MAVEKTSAPVDLGTPAPPPEMQERIDKITAEHNGEAPTGVEETPTVAERPDYVPEKFWNAESGEADMQAWAQSYNALERKLSEGSEASAPEGGDQESDGGESTDAGDQEAVAFDKQFEPFSQEFEQNGELSEQSYGELQKMGFSKSVVDTFIAGQVAQSQAYDTGLLETVGGDNATWESMVDWASANLDASQKAAFRASINSGDLGRAKLAAQGLYAQYKSNVSTPPTKQVEGHGGPSTSSSDAYDSYAELVADQRNPEYRTNPTFRKKVAAKLARSNI